jgi:hypothetical protein
MKPRTPKSGTISKATKREPTLLEELSKPLKDFVEDFRLHGKEAIEQVRLESPSKYLELSTKLAGLVAVLKPEATPKPKTMEELGFRLLQSVNCPEDLVTGAMIEEAIKCQDAFVDQLVAIRDRAQGLMQ